MKQFDKMKCSVCGISFNDYFNEGATTYCPGDIGEPEECGFYEDDEEEDE